MEQLRLLELGRENSLRIPLSQEIRDKLIRKMTEAIVIVFKAQKGENHDSVKSQDPI